jgi:hypothetical protein
MDPKTLAINRPMAHEIDGKYRKIGIEQTFTPPSQHRWRRRQRWKYQDCQDLMHAIR